MADDQRTGSGTPPGPPAHVKGIRQGNARGNYEQPGRATTPTGPRRRERSTGINPKDARPDRPADAEPLARRSRVGSRLPARRAAGAIPELAFAVEDAERARATPRCRRCASRCASTEARRAADPVGAARRADPDRGAPARATTTAAQRAAVRALRRAGRAGARRCGRCRGRARRSSCRPSTGSTVVDAAGAVQLRPRGRGVALLRRARATARCRSSSSSAAPCFYDGPDGGAPGHAHLLGERGRVPAARCAVWKETMERYFPRQRRGCGCGKRHLRPALAYQVAQRAADLGARASTRCCEEDGE